MQKADPLPHQIPPRPFLALDGCRVTAAGVDLNGIEVREEILADFTGDALADPQFLQTLEAINATTLRLFVNQVQATSCGGSAHIRKGVYYICSALDPTESTMRHSGDSLLPRSDYPV